MTLSLRGQTVLVLGHGISGQAMARWCVRQGASVTVADTRHQAVAMQALGTELTALAATSDAPAPQVVSAAFDEALMSSRPWDRVCKSPGLSPAQLQAVTQWTGAHGVPVQGELELFAQGLRLAYADTPAPKVIAITGTNGKTTTTSLTGQLLDRAGYRVAVAGNIGPAMLDVLSNAMTEQAEAQAAAASVAASESVATEKSEKNSASSLDSQQELATNSGTNTSTTLPQVWVLELSSFQLDGVASGDAGFEPTAATVLNITQDHLDWHGSMAAYTEAKFRIFGQRAIRVLNREDDGVMAARPVEATARKGKGSAADMPAPVEWLSFGTDLPRRPGDWGLEVVNGMAWLVRALPSDEPAPRRRSASADASELVLQRLMPAEALRIRGRHNAANALAALALATAIGAPLAPMLHGLREYTGEPHRVESVAVLNGVEFFDDSKGTNVGATLAAIKGLGAERRLVMILGGDGKGQDFSPLADPVRTHVQAVVLIGKDAPAIRDALSATGVPLVDAPDLPSAVREAATRAREGEAVVMSPACASLDMFRNYAHRAEVFRQTVSDLAIEQGQMGVDA